jgi:hypothetical protein
MNNASELHVVSLGFGRFGVIRGSRLTAAPMTKAVADKLARHEITTQEVEDMAKQAALDTLRTRRQQGYETRAKLQADIEQLARTQGGGARHQLKLKRAALAKLEAELVELLQQEIAVEAQPVVDAVVAPVDDVDALIAKLAQVTAEIDRTGATTLSAAKVIKLIDSARFLGASGHSGTALRLVVDRFLRLPVSLADKKLQSAGWQKTFATWIIRRHPAATAAAQADQQMEIAS